MANDKKTIGIANENIPILQELLEFGHFNSELDAAKFAMAHAIRQGTSPGETESAPTKWNIGTVDNDGSISTLIGTIYQKCEEPYRLIEYLMNEGLKLLRQKSTMQLDVYEVLFPPSK